MNRTNAMDGNTVREFSISTPSGRRVLVAIEPINFAFLRTVFEPSIDNSCERLQLQKSETDPIRVSADGTWINHRQLYAIANGIVTRAKTPMNVDRIRDMLFFDGIRPDVTSIFRALFATRHPKDRRYWNEMFRHARFDPNTATLHPII